MKYMYTATFTPFADGTGYECRVPDIPHCVTSGRDVSDALNMIRDCACAMLSVYEDDGVPIPAAADPAGVKPPLGGFTTLLQLDTDLYRSTADARPVRATVTLPAWMKAKARERGVNLSQALQDTLRARFGI